MPDFEARIRVDYRDIQGLVLDLNSDGIEFETPSNKVTRWRNDAAPRIRSIPTYARYKDAVQPVVANQPLVGSTGGVPHVLFDAASSEFLSIDMNGDFGGTKADFTFSYEIDAIGADPATNQSVFGADELDLYTKGTPNTTDGFRTDAITDFNAGPHPDDTVVLYRYPASSMNRWENGVDQTTDAAAAGIDLGSDAVNPVATLGGNNSGGGFFDGSLRNMRVWNRELHTGEIEFAFQSLAATGVDYSGGSGFATVTRRVWNDATAIPPRVNPTLEAPHRFLVATIPVGGTGFIQLEATIGGVVLPDSALGGDLFAAISLETPNGVIVSGTPVEAGFSMLQQFRLESVGHYTIEFRHAGANGAIIFHIDVEEES